MIKNLLLAGFILVTTSCATRLATPAGVPEISVANYEKTVIDKTKKVEVYDGLYNTLTVQATWVDSLMTEYSLSHSARLLQWNEAKYREERGKRVAKNAESTEFFVSFYTPEKKHSDLNSTHSPWKVFLDVNGQRYEGKATKIKLLLSEIQAMYKYHNRWSVPYSVTFPVATSLVENKPATLTFTGPVGNAELKYNIK
ncbi:MAG: hypothetical protein ACXVAX_06825 [Pseudobdellovibrio sp.]